MFGTNEAKCSIFSIYNYIYIFVHDTQYSELFLSLSLFLSIYLSLSDYYIKWKLLRRGRTPSLVHDRGHRGLTRVRYHSFVDVDIRSQIRERTVRAAEDDDKAEKEREVDERFEPFSVVDAIPPLRRRKFVVLDER